MAATNKCLARSNKSAREPNATKKHEIGQQRWMRWLMIREKIPSWLSIHSCSTRAWSRRRTTWRAAGASPRSKFHKLTKDWITAVRSWLAHKDHTKERTMDDLAAELRLRGLEPPYLAVEQ